MSGQLSPDIGPILLLFGAGTILWAVLLVVTWNDADETYGTGLFWGLMVLFVPCAALPVYWLMRLGTHRSWREDLAASERRDRRRIADQRLPGLVHGHYDSGSEPVAISRTQPVCRDFTPYRARFANEVETWCQQKASNISSSQGCGDSRSGIVEPEREHGLKPASRWVDESCTGRTGGDGKSARPVPF
ncbi:hypothetical protein JW859_14295 [bacterium]|nr:hypothetical protein [bacterium]